jgi:hypothetical protein
MEAHALRAGIPASGFKVRYAAAYPKLSSLRASGKARAVGIRNRQPFALEAHALRASIPASGFKVRYAAAYPKLTLRTVFSSIKMFGIRN